MLTIRLPAFAARALIAAFAALCVALPALAQSPDETAIRRAFDDVRQMAKPGMAAAPATMAPDMAGFYARIARRAYGTEGMGAPGAGYLEAYGVYMLRGVAFCRYLGPQKDTTQRTLQGGDAVGALDMLRGADAAWPWGKGDESLGAIQVTGDTATAEYRWSGTRPLGRGTPLSFTDKVEFRRADARWTLAFDSYAAMLDRHWTVLATSVVPKIEPADMTQNKNAAALDVATARAFDYLGSPACPDSSAHLKRLTDAKQGDALENFRGRLNKLLQTPVQDWPEPRVLAWWNK
jgi:hypothetical protein